MNYLQQFQSVFRAQKRGVAKLIVQHRADSWQGQTAAGVVVQLTGAGYTAGQIVFYDVYSGRILETAPDVQVVELKV